MAVGIDLGTTNSLVAAVIDGRPRCLPADVDNDPLLPSVVFYDKEGIAVVGKRARALATLHPTNTIASVKRFMGRSPQDPETRKLGSYRFAAGGNVVRFELDGVPPVTPIEVSAEILRALKRRAESALYGKVEQAVITVPAYFDEAQRQATRDAGRLAGLEVLRLLNEPTAAALAYGLDKGSQGSFAVYDLGGGTFDISILQLVEGVFEVKATGGDSALGGDDFDRAIAERLLPALGISSPSPAEIAQVLAAARVAKEALTDAGSTEIVLGSHRQQLSRDEFDEWTAPLVQRTGAVCRRALKDAGISPAQLDGVILVGGATRMPSIRRYVTELFGRAPLTDLDPDQVVAMGAAIQADLLTRKDRQDEVLLLDVIPLSLGLETMGGVVEKLIPRNSTVPTTAAQVFTTFAEGQTGIDIHVLQGERELVEDCRSLARFRLSGIPPMPPGMARVEVTFEVDADGLLSVSARELSTGLSQSIEVKPTHGLTEDEIDQMLLDSIENAETDVRIRLVREQRVLADRTLTDARKQLADNEDLLLPGERATIESAMEQVRSAAEGSEPHRIREALHALDHVTQPFAERIMNRAIRRVLTGRAVEDLEG